MGWSVAGAGLTPGTIAIVLAPVIFTALSLWRGGRIRWRDIAVWIVVMTILISTALYFVATVANAKLPLREIVVVLWFAAGAWMAWSAWRRAVNRLGESRRRLARLRARHNEKSPWPVRFIGVGRAALTVCVLIPALLGLVFTHRFKLRDGVDPRSLLRIPFESVRIEAEIPLDAWFIPQPRTKRTILICHGAGANKGNFIWFVPPLLAHGYNLVLFDFRAHGASGGRACTYGLRERDDVLAVARWLKREHPEETEKLVGLGSSLGAQALTLAAADEPIFDALILDSPFMSPRDLARHHCGRVPGIGPVFADIVLASMSFWTLTNFFDGGAIAAAQRITVPTLLIHGDDDVLMPPAHAEKLRAALGGPSSLWSGPGPHSNIITTAPEEYEKRVFDFLDGALGKPSIGTAARDR